MKKFEVGKTYFANGSGIPAIKIIKRTAKMCLVEDVVCNNQWRMRIRISKSSDHEEMTDSTVPITYRNDYTYSAKQEDRIGGFLK